MFKLIKPDNAAANKKKTSMRENFTKQDIWMGKSIKHCDLPVQNTMKDLRDYTF